MASQKLIVVIGATGFQGRSVVDSFLKDPTWKIRALTRNPSSSKAQTLATLSPNIEVVSADAIDAASLVSAFQGATAIFGMTDFWSVYMDSSNRSKPSPGQTFPEWVQSQEIQHGKNIFDAASQIPTLERLVFSSLVNASKWSGGKYTHALHFDSKAIAAEYGQTTYPDLWTKTSIIQLGFYLSNFLPGSLMTPHKADDGSGTIVFGYAGSGSKAAPLVAAENETGEITKALVENVPAGKNVIAYRELMTMDDFVQLWGKTVGVSAKLELSGLKLPEELKQEMEDTFNFVNEFGFWGDEDKSVVHPKDLGVKFDFGSIEEWIKKQDWSAILGQ